MSGALRSLHLKSSASGKISFQDLLIGCPHCNAILKARSDRICGFLRHRLSGRGRSGYVAQDCDKKERKYILHPRNFWHFTGDARVN